MTALIDPANLNAFLKAFLWIVQRFPFSYQISNYLSDRFGLPGIPGVYITDSYGSFCAVLVGAVLLAGIKLIVSAFSKKTSELIFPDSLTELLFGSYKTKLSKLFRFALWLFAGVSAAFVCGLVADLLCAPIGSFIRDKLPSGTASAASGNLISFLIFLCMFVIFSTIYAVIIFFKRKASGKDKQVFDIMRGHASYPVIRFLILNVIPDVLCIIGTHFWAILSFMFFCNHNILQGIISLACILGWYIASQLLTEVLEYRVTSYYSSYTVMYTVSNLFTLLEEIVTVTLFYVMVLNPRGEQDLMEISGFRFPLIDCFRLDMSWEDLTMAIGPKRITDQMLILLFFLLIYFILNRLVTNLFSTAAKKAGILLTILLWWLKVSILFITSLLLTRGIIYTLYEIDLALAVFIVIAIIFLVLFFSPPVLQHVVIVFAFILGLTFIVTATGFFSESYLLDNDHPIRYIITSLVLIAIGAVMALIHVLTWPSKLTALTVVPNNLPMVQPNKLPVVSPNKLPIKK